MGSLIYAAVSAVGGGERPRNPPQHPIIVCFEHD